MTTIGIIRKAILIGSVRAIAWALGYKQPSIVPLNSGSDVPPGGRMGDTDMYEFGEARLGFKSEGISDGEHAKIQNALNKVGMGISELMDQDQGPAQMIAMEMMIAIYCSIFGPMCRHDDDMDALLKKTRNGLEGARRSFQEDAPITVDENGSFASKKSSTLH